MISPKACPAQAAGCIIGRDYPAPIVDHAVVNKENMAKMKAAYDAAREDGDGDCVGGGAGNGSRGGKGSNGGGRPAKKMRA